MIWASSDLPPVSRANTTSRPLPCSPVIRYVRSLCAGLEGGSVPFCTLPPGGSVRSHSPDHRGVHGKLCLVAERQTVGDQLRDGGYLLSTLDGDPGLGRLWPTLAKPSVAQTQFGQTICGPNPVWPNPVWPIPTFWAKLTRIRVSMFWAIFCVWPMLGLPGPLSPPPSLPFPTTPLPPQDRPPQDCPSQVWPNLVKVLAYVGVGHR